MGILKKYPAIIFGVGITLLFLIFAFVRVDLLETLELKFYDARMSARGGGGSTEAIALVDIDNDSIEKLGRWPWPRSRIAEVIGKIADAGAKIIGLNVIYSEPEDSSALRELRYLTRILAETVQGAESQRVVKALEEAQQRLDNDRKLANTLTEAGNVVLPVFFRPSLVPENLREKALLLTEDAVKNVTHPEGVLLPDEGKVNMPIEEFFKPAVGVGHVNLEYDVDGTARREPVFFRYGDLYIPSFTLALTAQYLGIPMQNVTAVLGEGVSVGMLDIPMTQDSDFLVSFKGEEGTFSRYSFFDTLNEKFDLDKAFADKIVLITPSAPGILNPISTPLSGSMSVGEFSANSIWSMLNRKFVEQPAWNDMASYGLIILIGFLIAFVMPRLKALFAGVLFVGLLAVMIGVPFYLFVSAGIWLEIIYPTVLLVVGYIGVMTLNYFVTETRKEKVEEQSAETNRMLGISFQSQGMLDMAFDKFRRVPVDGEVKALLYNLGLDYERKRQLNKAAAVYEYIEEHDSKYKDVTKRKQKLLHASETMVFGDGFLTGGSTGDDLLSGDGGTRPTLGRYEIQKQLGKGAMGVVYLGQDPRINRTTAIKTFRFTEDHEPEEAEKLKAKFFREAESAGTLSHPNIVTIYDAGDEGDVAYIAMEYLEGDDLQKYTKKSTLLPIRRVIDVIADIAEGLDYAHSKGIVHRDVKPANIMMNKNGVIKITDFGIARITASSQTQTGVVKGTPHYMSPEQISGEKVDGRSDIFSLGAMMFQMLTGKVPFKGDSPAALMHQIMNTPHPDPRKINPKIVKPLVTIIDKAMAKKRDGRYQSAAQMAAHLRALGKKIDAHTAMKKQQQATAS